MPTIIAIVQVGPVDTTPPIPAKPSAVNTGWAPTGVTLTPYPASGGPAGPISSGTLTISTPNLTLDSYDFACRVAISAANVTIKRSKIRGTSLLTGLSYGLIQTTSSSCVNFVAEDCDIIPDFPSYRWTGALGHNGTYRRCKMTGSVDGGGGYNANSAAAVNNVYEQCYIDKLGYFSPDPNHTNDQPVSHTHSDGYQGQGGPGHTFRYCTVIGMCDTTLPSADGSATGDILRTAANPNSLGGYNIHDPSTAGNSAFQFTQPSPPVGSPVSNVTIDSCWIDGGAFSINFGPGVYDQVTIINNQFGTQQRQGVFISVPNAATNVTITGNVYEATGLPVPVQRY